MQKYEIVQEAKNKQTIKQYGNFDEEGKDRVRRILSQPVSYLKRLPTANSEKAVWHKI